MGSPLTQKQPEITLISNSCNSGNRRHHDTNLRTRRPVRPPSTHKQSSQRSRYWKIRHFRNVLCTDESKFGLALHERCRRIRCQRNKRFRKCCISSLTSLVLHLLFLGRVFHSLDYLCLSMAQLIF